MGMKESIFRRLSLGVTAAFLFTWAGNAEAVSSLSKPGEEIEKAQPQADASVKADLPEVPSEQKEVRFTIANVRLDAQELKLNKEALAGILSESVGVACERAEAKAAGRDFFIKPPICALSDSDCTKEM